ncbi:Na+/H+ antiporter NhaA [Candidatus Cyrtobacter comes]|uniref:Na(+)/H(+) antiporter NhaA n=1 Tax=Candidatus Cyrtobacter comes TaxID=675776 RepID=A0ABU5L753_9RICK|nr:Na+/H+ antiporter NhaA [Candidatus Cyrtobacter comes]MDZ5761956.1 Na+/H+ antiporter NhaA [Candidatus Cyrtobacter comes]
MIAIKVKNFGILIHSAIENGWLLFIAAALGIFTANSKYSELYQHYISSDLKLIFADYSVGMSMANWVNELLMAFFFLIVGMEIKREIVEGRLSSPAQRILPIVGAFGGIVVPVLIYCVFNIHNDTALKAWATPAATDIAFAIGVMGIFGKGIPTSLRVFLTALAIIDDLVSVLIIAIFYNESINIEYLFYISICIALLFYLNRRDVSSKFVYLVIGGFMWSFFLQSGIHATVAGAVLGMLIPIRSKTGTEVMADLERGLGPLNYYVILPLFAFVNSGLSLSNFSLGDLLHPIVLGTGLGLFFGKQIGIFSACYILIKMGKAKLPEHSTYAQFYGTSVVCGIGFTMSLFIALLAFAHNTTYLNEIKLGIMLGSLASLIIGAIIISITGTRKSSV